MVDCRKCSELQIISRIDLPGDLQAAIQRAREHLEKEILSLVDEYPHQGVLPFTMLPPEGGWGDVVHYLFECTSCGRQFELFAETYHGSGGTWKPVSSS